MVVRAKTARRLAAIEAKRKPSVAILVCKCAWENGRVNLPDGEHLTGCPAVEAKDGDTIIRIVYDARKTTSYEPSM